MDLRLSVFTVQTFDLTPEETAAELQWLGYNGVEWRITHLPAELPAEPNFWNANICTFEIADIAAQAPRLLALSAAHGLALPTLGTYLSPSDLPQVEACLDAAARIGVPMLRVGLPGWNHQEAWPVVFDRAVEQWEPVVELGRKYAVRVLVEMHHNSLLPNGAATARFLSRWLSEEVGAIYDPGNMVHEGWEHPDLTIGVLGPYLAHVHVKNARWLKTGDEGGRAVWRGEMCRLREGQVDWRAVFASLDRAGYAGWCSTEDFGSGDSRQKLADNAAALREWAAA